MPHGNNGPDRAAWRLPVHGASLEAELDRLAGALEHAGRRVTERDLNYAEDSAELFYERDGERYQIHLKRLPDQLPE